MGPFDLVILVCIGKCTGLSRPGQSKKGKTGTLRLSYITLYNAALIVCGCLCKCTQWTRIQLIEIELSCVNACCCERSLRRVLVLHKELLIQG